VTCRLRWAFTAPSLFSPIRRLLPLVRTITGAPRASRKRFPAVPTGAAFHLAESCYDREYLFQFSEIDPKIHQQAIDQLAAITACTTAAVAGVPCPTLDVATEPYHPTYFMINGRSMPDDMDTNYAQEYPHQPYNGDPTCIQANSCCCASSVKAAGNILSTSTAITFVSGPRWQYHPQPDGSDETCWTIALHHYHNAWPGNGWNLLLEW